MFKRDKGEKGVATILVVGVLVVFLIFFLVLAIDFAYIYVVRGQVQNAADAAAIAGADLINDPNDTVQFAARDEAIKFAARNSAAGKPVVIVTNNSNNLSGGNDITVGSWDGSTYTRGAQPVNAMEVRPRRTQGSPDGPVGLFFGRLVSWPEMEVSRIAVATRPPTPTSGTSLCIQSCTEWEDNIPPGGVWFYFKEQDQPTESQGLAFTRFSCNRDTPLGKDSEVAKYIKGELDAPNVCNQCIVTNNAHGSLMPILSDAYDENKDENGNWRVIVPVVNVAGAGGCPNCTDPSPGTEACPVGSQSQEPFIVEQYAVILINGVNDDSVSPSMRIADIQCTPCPALELYGKRAKLVR